MQNSDLFIYIHIPYCRSRCSYCDFVTFEENKILPVKEYVKILKQEIKNKSPFFEHLNVQTIYFGGGTPSLIPAENITDILKEVKQNYALSSQPEITIEVNPGTLDEHKLDIYKKSGVNRFSLGVQTFNSWFLEKSHCAHSVEDSLETLHLFQKEKLNFSLDLMFGLPKQNLSDLKMDICQALSFDPPHISLYNLTVPSQHELSKNRPSEEEQKDMFQWIEEKLKPQGLKKYEISNFAKPPFFSKHNVAYWEGKTVLGFGLSAHSYLSSDFKGFPERNLKNSYGIRFWNASQMPTYLQQSALKNSKTPFDSLKSNQVEFLTSYESLTDFCYTRLRTKKGLCLKELAHSYPQNIFDYTHSKLKKLHFENWLEKRRSSFRLTKKGEILSNQVFLELTFLKKDFSSFKETSIV